MLLFRQCKAVFTIAPSSPLSPLSLLTTVIVFTDALPFSQQSQFFPSTGGSDKGQEDWEGEPHRWERGGEEGGKGGGEAGEGAEGGEIH